MTKVINKNLYAIFNISGKLQLAEHSTLMQENSRFFSDEDIQQIFDFFWEYFWVTSIQSKIISLALIPDDSQGWAMDNLCFKSMDNPFLRVSLIFTGCYYHPYGFRKYPYKGCFRNIRWALNIYPIITANVRFSWNLFFFC